MALNEKLWRCDCGAEALCVSFYTWPNQPNEWFIEIYLTPGAPNLRWRLSQIWKLLLGQETHIEAVALNETKAQELIDFLKTNIPDA